jgi:AmiR/NasT family two-component response regulator
MTALREARAELLAKLEGRKQAVRAKGILMRRLGIDEAQAHLVLQHRARNTRRPLGSAVDEVLAADRFFSDLEHSLREP